MTSFRLKKGGLIDRATWLRFTFDGKRFEGHAGDTLASALMANGVRFDGPVIQISPPAWRHFRRLLGT